MRDVQMPFGLAILAIVSLSTGVQAGSLTFNEDEDITNAVVMFYDPATGDVRLDGRGTLLTTFEMTSAGCQLDPSQANQSEFLGPFDIVSSCKFFKLSVDGFGAVDFGPIFPVGTSPYIFLEDVAVDGSILPFGGLEDAPGGGPYLQGIPEPSSLTLLAFGLLGLLGRRRF